ncbi:hypothetical protein ACHAWU_001885, partial [Discostella pseudostelligera]
IPTKTTFASRDDDDLENGCSSASSSRSRSSSFYSQGYESDSSDHYSQHDAELIDTIISTKFLVSYDDDGSNNKPPRRLSQCEQLVSRRRQSSFTLPMPTQPAPIVSTTSATAATNTRSLLFRQLWEAMIMPWNIADSHSQPTKYKCSTSHPASSQLLSRLIITILVVITFGGLLLFRHQQHQISSLQSQLTIINQHRLFLEHKQSELVTQLHSSDASLEQCKHTQKQMASAHEVVGNTMGALRREYTETRELLMRCQEEVRMR